MLFFSFIEHRFKDENDLCFDLEQSSRAKIRLEDGKFTEYPLDVARMSADQCAKFLDYQLAVTTDSDRDKDRIDEIFGRINSGGRQLSPQEQRQAGLASGFSEFVRKLAVELRGDPSPDVLTLNDMPAISFDTPKERQNYGIEASEVFWCKHGIIPANGLARSIDEEIISDLAISILNNISLNASKEVLNDYYDKKSPRFSNINTSLLTYGSERLRSEIVSTISSIRTVFETDGFVSFRNCVYEKSANSAKTSFFAVFFAFYRLIFKQGMYPDNFAKIRAALKNSQKKMTRSAHHIMTDNREKDINIITGLIQDAFVKKDVTAFGGAHALAAELENSLRRARYESNRYEFKAGICRQTNSPVLDQSMYQKLARTACAIANTEPGKDGYIYLGVADNKEASERISKRTGQEAISIGEVFFISLDFDLGVMKITMEEYMKKLISGIEK